MKIAVNNNDNYDEFAFKEKMSFFSSDLFFRSYRNKNNIMCL